MMLEVVKAASPGAGKRLLTHVEEPCDASKPDSPAYVPVSYDWVPQEGCSPCVPPAASFESGRERPPTDGAPPARLRIGSIDTLSSKVQTLTIPSEGDQALAPDGLAQDEHHEDSTDMACFLNMLFPPVPPPALRAPSSWPSHGCNRSTSAEPSRWSLR
jgi:hypothetical protein